MKFILSQISNIVQAVPHID